MFRFFVMSALVGLALTSFSQQPIFHVGFDDPNALATTQELTTGKVLSIRNTFGRPERIASNFGQALRLDGYSTYLTDAEWFIEDFRTALTIEVWYATDAFTKEPASIIQSQNDSGGFKLQVDSYGSLVFSFFYNGQKRTLKPNKRLTPYLWHHIVASIDALSGKVVLYVNGESWLSNNIGENAVLNAAKAPLWIAKDPLNLLFSGFSLNTLNGALDDIKVYNIALSEQQIVQNFQQAETRKTALIVNPLVRHAGDYLRPQVHPMPNTSWTNEAYGLTFYEGKYHLFFQKNPNGPYLYFMHWGHLSSPDLVSWQEEPIALAPSFGFDNFGVWSGTTTFDKQGNPIIFYTGVDGNKAGIGSALPLDEDLIQWEKNRNNPLIPNPPSGYLHMDFRDPYIFQKNGLYYMIVGSGLNNKGGGILFSYTSEDLSSWKLVNPIFQSSDYVKHGTFWEMPAFFPISDDAYVLAVTPQFSGAPADAIYWIGSFDGRVFQPNGAANNLEHIGRNLLAPAFGRDEEGRWTYVGIIPDDRDVSLQIAAGWRHTFSLPRWIRLLDDQKTLATSPHPNLCRLRKDTLAVQRFEVSPNTINNLTEFTGNQCELYFKLNFSTAKVARIDVFKSASGHEKTTLVLDRENQRIGLDRRQSSPYQTVEDIRFEDYTFHPQGEVDVRIFLDHSVIEVFIDNLIVLSARVYPSANSQGIDITAENGMLTVAAFNGYSLHNKETLLPPITCPDELLPGALYTNSTNLPQQTPIRVYPNPVQDWLNIDVLGIFHLRIFDLQGRLQLSRELSQGEISLQHLQTGIYVLQIVNIHGSQSTLIFKQ